MSFWRDDETRQIEQRVQHLVSKLGIARWLWIVGDSSDRTEKILRNFTDLDRRIHVFTANTGITGEDLETRRLRISATETLAYAALGAFDDIDYVIQHESDLRTPDDVALKMLPHVTGKTAVAGWPTLELDNRVLFYDIWAYRGLDGQHFGPRAPYHRDYRADRPFEVASFGSVWMARRSLWFDREIKKDCCVELCQQWRAEGVRLLVDPTIPVEQPRGLWTAQ